MQWQILIVDLEKAMGAGGSEMYNVHSFKKGNV